MKAADIPDLWILGFEQDGKPVLKLITSESEAETRTRAGQDVFRVTGFERATKRDFDACAACGEPWNAEFGKRHGQLLCGCCVFTHDRGDFPCGCPLPEVAE
jgi:formylmethanofuran dehydrogenase subunit E